jgi:hypothetical protein
MDPIKFQKMLPKKKDKFLKKSDCFNISEYRNSLNDCFGASSFSIPGFNNELTSNIFRKVDRI